MEMVNAIVSRIVAAFGLITVCTSSIVYGTDSVKLSARWEKDETGYYIKLQPTAPGSDTPISRPIISPTSPLFASTDLLKLQKKDGTVLSDVSFTIEGRPKEGRKLFIKVRPKKPETLATHVIEVHNTASGQPGLDLEDNGKRLTYLGQTTVKAFNPDTATTSVDQTKLDTSQLKLGDGFASLLGGAGGAVVSGKVNASLGRVFNDQLYLKANGTVDVSVEGTDPKKYFNSIVGEVNATYVFVNRDYFLIGQQWPEIGFVGRIESDRDFETVDGTVGLGGWITIDNGLTRLLGRTIYVGRRPDIDPPQAAPAVWMSYDYVGKITNDDSDPKVETGNNRLKANLYWPLWVAHGWNLTAGIIDSTYSLRFVVDVTPIYDIEKSRVFVEDKLSLEVMPETTTGKKPTFVFSYANGKATPTFQNVDALLAGIKLPW